MTRLPGALQETAHYGEWQMTSSLHGPTPQREQVIRKPLSWPIHQTSMANLHLENQELRSRDILSPDSPADQNVPASTRYRKQVVPTTNKLFAIESKMNTASTPQGWHLQLKFETSL